MMTRLRAFGLAWSIGWILFSVFNIIEGTKHPTVHVVCILIQIVCGIYWWMNVPDMILHRGKGT
jgi:hypothetical protein